MSNLEKQLTDLISRLETVTKRLETVENKVAAGGSTTPVGPTSASVEEFQGLIDQFIVPLVESSGKMDAVLKQQADLLLQAVQAQKAFLSTAAQSKKPADAALQELVKPVSDLMGKIVDLKEKNRSSKFFNNLSTIAEGIGALGWVVVSPAPGPMVGEMRGSAEFYGNRILKDFKGKDQAQCDWVAFYVNFLKELQAFVKKYHTTGTTWNPQGGDAKSVQGSQPAPAPAPGPGGPPPPPPPSLERLMEGVGSEPKQESKPATGALFSAINQGGAVTSGLKKVSADMQTHKNPNLRAGSVVPAKDTSSTTSSAPAKTTNKFTAGPPKIALEGNKWVVEYQVNNQSIVIDQTELKQTVYIYRCKGSTIQIKGKVNSVSLDDCEKVGIVFENVLSGVEAVNCRSIQVQSLGKIPTITIDKTSGGQIFLSKESLEVEIITSTSSELNVSIPQQNDEVTETPVPEQFKSTVKNGKLHTEHVVHKG